jgi:nitroreductase
MELLDALRSTGAVREFTDAPVADEALLRILDTARFAPSGGNRQGWRVVVVRDAETRREVRDLYLPGWYDYLAVAGSGLTPFAPVTDRDSENAALTSAPSIAAAADLRALAATDRDAERYTFVGGASVYPFAWSILLAAREEGLGGVMTTMNVRREDEMKTLLHAGPELALAAVIALGHPVHAARRLRRSSVEDVVSVDRVDGPRFGAA